MISLLFFENIINSTLKIQFNFHIQQKFFICDDKTTILGQEQVWFRKKWAKEQFIQKQGQRRVISMNL